VENSRRLRAFKSAQRRPFVYSDERVRMHLDPHSQSSILESNLSSTVMSWIFVLLGLQVQVQV